MVQTIAEFEALEPDRGSSEYYYCLYSLGALLFHDLYHNMDDTTFRLAFRHLYLHTVVHDVCDDPATTICHVREAFTTYAPEEARSVVEDVIARWYDVPEPYDLSRREDTPIRPDIAAIDGRIEEAYLSLTRGGLPVSVVIVGPNRNSVVYLHLDYSYRNPSDLEFLPIEVELYRDDGSEIHRVLRELLVLPLPAGVTRQTHVVMAIPLRDTGRYRVHVYRGEQKIAEATVEAVPERKLRGVVTGPDGQPLENVVGLWAKHGEEEVFWAETGQDGAFGCRSVVRVVHPWKCTYRSGSHFHFVGWYDGTGITTDPSQAFEVIVDGAAVEVIDIMLPTDAEGLLCPSGSRRSVSTGSCMSR